MVGAPVHRRIALLIEFLLGFDDTQRVLRRGSGVQIDQRASVDQLVQDREVVADALHLGVIHDRQGAFQCGWR
jgi:hypothetical protein